MAYARYCAISVIRHTFDHDCSATRTITFIDYGFHIVIAFTTSVAEKVGPSARWLHFGMTSSDVIDTAQALQMREACDIILRDLGGLADITDAAYDAAAPVQRTVTAAPPVLSKSGGDGQSDLTGRALNLPLAVSVNDPLGAPLSGRTVAWAIAGTPSGATGQGLSANTSTTQRVLQLLIAGTTVRVTQAGAASTPTPICRLSSWAAAWRRAVPRHPRCAFRAR